MHTMNGTHDARLLQRHCDNDFQFNKVAVIGILLNAFIYLEWAFSSVIQTAVLVYSPISFLFTILSILVLREIAKEYPDLHTISAMKAEIATQLIAFLMLIINHENLISLFPAPFC